MSVDGVITHHAIVSIRVSDLHFLRIRIRAKIFMRIRCFFHVLDDFKKFEKEIMKNFSAPNCLKRMKSICCPFPPDLKMMPAYFFLVSKAFLKEYSVILILIPEVLTPTLQNYDLFIPFLSFLPGSKR